MYKINTKIAYEPAEDAKYKVEHEERSEDDKSDEVNPRPFVAFRIVHLSVHSRQGRMRIEAMKSCNWLFLLLIENKRLNSNWNSLPAPLRDWHQQQLQLQEAKVQLFSGGCRAYVFARYKYSYLLT